ncbi:polysaccharide biosynthesis/export family protein [Parabacteroides sp.]|uniref:polysaccharide biosynthesis/export family protein n=1 Tax=Parabacteroides sp. TaxID=1869337 RepID=UPI0026E010CD|nr:polysaccharide biosynthesis/export family protein [Parabacteroides sp.]MDO5428791.1 polysaccharide biosynthesis/export family protein [Parabacteroides sp.]
MSLRYTFINVLVSIALLSSCSTPKGITYMQGMFEEMPQEIIQQSRITVQPDDKLSIVVSSKDPELAEVFNLAVARHQVGQSITNNNNMQQTALFTVSPSGFINYPVIGEIYIAGLNRQEVAQLIQKELISQNLLKDPVVTVEFMNTTVSVLGDVSHPGEYPIDRDDLNVIQAISKAGDLNITGLRENVLVVRKKDEKNIAYRLDLTNAQSLFQSPAFYLRQNDIVYVEPNNMKKRQSTVNGNTVQTPSLWISIISLLTTISVLVFK